MLNFLSFHDIMSFRFRDSIACNIAKDLRFGNNFLCLVRDKAIHHMLSGHLPAGVFQIDGFIISRLIHNLSLLSKMKQFVPHNDVFAFLDMVIPLI